MWTINPENLKENPWLYAWGGHEKIITSKALRRRLYRTMVECLREDDIFGWSYDKWYEGGIKGFPLISIIYIEGILKESGFSFPKCEIYIDSFAAINKHLKYDMELTRILHSYLADEEEAWEEGIYKMAKEYESQGYELVYRDGTFNWKNLFYPCFLFYLLKAPEDADRDIIIIQFQLSEGWVNKLTKPNVYIGNLGRVLSLEKDFLNNKGYRKNYIARVLGFKTWERLENWINLRLGIL